MNKEDLVLFVEQNATEADEQRLLNHVNDCFTCQKQIGEIFYSGITSASLSESEITYLKIQIRHQVQKNNQSSLISWQLLINFVFCIQPSSLAAANDQTSNQKLAKAAFTTRVLYFEAICRKTEAGYWRAELALPSAPSPETLLSVRFKDAHGNLIPNGILTFCNIEKPVSNGQCFLSIAELRGNIKNQTISFRKKDQPAIKGILELFPEEKEGL